jgi:hypothetical protein
MLEDIVEATGAPGDSINMSAYARTSARHSRNCGDLDEDDRWWAYQSVRLIDTEIPRDELMKRLVDFFADNSFTYNVYRATGPDSGSRNILASRDEWLIKVTRQSGTGAHINVRSGPCAPFSANPRVPERLIEVFGEERFGPVD